MLIITAVASYFRGQILEKKLGSFYEIYSLIEKSGIFGGLS